MRDDPCFHRWRWPRARQAKVDTLNDRLSDTTVELAAILFSLLVCVFIGE